MITPPPPPPPQLWVKRFLKNIIPAVGKDNTAIREIYIERTLKKILPGQRILDAGAGELRYKKYCSHLNYIAQDFDKYDGIGNGKSFHKGTWDQSKLDIVCDIIDIPEPDNSFDAIMCIEVLEHLPDPVLAIKEFSRLIRSGGKLILTAPFCSLTHFAPFHFSSGFNVYWYEKHLIDYGFKILEIEKNGNYFEYLAQEWRRLNFIVKKYTCNKFTIFDKMIALYILNRLKTYSKNDTKSNDVLYYGCHVFAEKE